MQCDLVGGPSGRALVGVGPRGATHCSMDLVEIVAVAVFVLVVLHALVDLVRPGLRDIRSLFRL